MIDEYGVFGGMRIGKVKPKYLDETCPNATLSPTNPTQPGMGSNPSRRGGKPAANRMTYGTAFFKQLIHF
jgi:hypothetical protein